MIVVVNSQGKEVSFPESELEFTAIRAEGPGGQHVNKTSSAVMLRFNIDESSLPLYIKNRLKKLSDNHVTPGGEILIKVQDERSQIRNRETAIERFKEIILKVLFVPKKRKKTKPTRGSVEKRLKSKKNRSNVKKMRGKVID